MQVIFSDGSNSAYGACVYVRWVLNGGLVPVKAMSIDRIELCGAVLSKRLKELLER